jgi:WD40 repeat protein
MMDDYYLNLISWSDTNILAVALAQTVYLWNAASGDIQELCTFDSVPNSYITSVAWVQEGGAHLAVGTSDGSTQLWDVQECKQLRSMDGHTDRVGASLNRHLLTGRDTHHQPRRSSSLPAFKTRKVCELPGLDGDTRYRRQLVDL